MPSFTLTVPDAMQQAHAAFGAGRHAEAAELCGAVVAAAPDFFDAVYLLAHAQMAAGHIAAAAASFDRAVALRPDFAPAFNNRGNALHRLGRFVEAVESYDRALAVAPDYALAHGNRGFALHGLKRFDEALESYDRALALRPDLADALNNRGLTLVELRRFDEALASYAAARAAAPDHPRAGVNEALLRLLIGDFRHGFAAYEARWTNPALALRHRDLPQPAWRGDAPIAGRTILVYGEQGFGDAIQFCRYVPLLAGRGARVVLEIGPPLRPLMTGLAGASRVICTDETPPAFDLHCSLLGLPLAFGTTLETIPAAVPYLQAPEPAAALWAARLGALPRPRIGVVWAGNPHHEKDHERSMPLATLRPLLETGASFVSLQKDLREGDAALLRQHEVAELGSMLADFADAAALIAQLDLVVAVDTSIAHLAGALAKPVFILLPYTPDWRWQLDRSDSPWYPTARLFRQRETRTWDDVVAQVADAVRRFAAAT